jgi:nitrous oxide reductase accessory protein NosL
MNSFLLSILAVVAFALAACNTTQTSPSAVPTGITAPGAGSATGLGTATSTSTSHSGQY